jgi:hypothetical protein
MWAQARRVIRRRISGRESATSRLCLGWVPVFGLDGGQEGVGQHGQGDVPVPAGVLADLVVVQAGLALGGLEGFLDHPADTGDGG